MTDAIAPAGTLRDGEHACCFFDNDEQQETLLGAFIEAGLRTGRKVICIADAASTRRIVGACAARPAGQAAVDRGQLEIASSDEMYIAGGFFDPDRLPRRWQHETARALEEGYPGLRVTGDVTWYTRELPGVERLVEYERALSGILAGTAAAALCQYDRRRLDDGLLAEALGSHGTVTGSRHPVADETFRALRTAPGTFELVGELDIAGCAALADALDWAVADGATHIRIDLSGLRFVDARGAATLCRPASDHGVTLELRGPQRMTRRILAILRMDEIPGVQLDESAGR